MKNTFGQKTEVKVTRIMAQLRLHTERQNKKHVNREIAPKTMTEIVTTKSACYLEDADVNVSHGLSQTRTTNMSRYKKWSFPFYLNKGRPTPTPTPNSVW